MNNLQTITENYQQLFAQHGITINPFSPCKNNAEYGDSQLSCTYFGDSVLNCEFWEDESDILYVNVIRDGKFILGLDGVFDEIIGAIKEVLNNE